MEIAKQFNITNFKASEGWLGKFKRRHSIVLKSIKGVFNDSQQNIFCTNEQDEQLDKLFTAYKV